VIGSVVRAVKSHSSGKKPNFDPKPQKSRNDSSYQFNAYSLKSHSVSLDSFAGFPDLFQVPFLSSH